MVFKTYIRSPQVSDSYNEMLQQGGSFILAFEFSV